MLGNRNGLTGKHRFVYLAGPFSDRAVDRDMLAGAHAEQIPRVHIAQGHILLGASLQEKMGHLGRKVHERPDGGIGVGVGTLLEIPPRSTMVVMNAVASKYSGTPWAVRNAGRKGPPQRAPPPRCKNRRRRCR